MVEASEAQLRNFACMSHEIRTPLNCVLGLASLLLDTELTPQQHDSMRMIVTSGELLSAIVNDILDYSKLITGNVEIDIQPTELQGVLDTVVHSIEVKAADRNIKLHTDYDVRIPKVVESDGRRLQQILYNLLGNAVKFSKDDGKIELALKIHESSGTHSASSEASAASGARTGEVLSEQPAMPTHESVAESRPNPIEVASRCPFHKSQAALSPRTTSDSSLANDTSRGECPVSDSTGIERTCPNKKFLRFVVTDYGRGIEQSNFSKIFKPFLQATGETEMLYGGTGLGLAITSKLVESLGGTISVDSEIGKWSEFTIDLPFGKAEADTDALSSQLGDARIMLVKRENKQALSPILVDTHRLSVEEFESCNELKVLAKVKGGIDKTRTYLCLVDEELYDHDDLDEFVKVAPGSSVLTFGPRYILKDTLPRGHYRSLVHLLPSAFVSSLIQVRTSDTSAILSGTTSHESTAPNYNSFRVLVAEDNLINQKVVKNMLKRVGIKHITTVDNGQKAVDAAAKELYTLILMDMQMPVLNGVEATKIILKQDLGQKQRVVFVTANVSFSFVKEAQEAGACGFISKPYNVRKFESFLVAFGEGKEFISVT